MRNYLKLTFLTLLLGGIAAFAMDEAEVLGKEKLRSDFFIQHLPDLGLAEKQFYQACIKLDNNLTIERPIVAIIGGLYEKRAIKVLQKTKRVRLVLNSADDRPFAKIKMLLTEKKYEDRIIFDSSNSFDLHKSPAVIEFFAGNPIAFNNILIENAFQFLSPEEFLNGLVYAYDHLYLGGALYLTGSETPKLDPFEREENNLVKNLEQFGETAQLNEKITTSSDTLKILQASCLAGFIRNMVPQTVALVTEFNSQNGIPFPGYNPGTDSVINPYNIRICDLEISSSTVNGRFFDMTPDEVCAWATAVGFTCVHAQTLKLSAGRHYFAKLVKEKAHREENCPLFAALLKSARTVERKIVALHDQKVLIFNLNENYAKLHIAHKHTSERRFKLIFSTYNHPAFLIKNKFCVQCDKQFPKLLICGKCKKVAYCSKACQKAGWPKHRNACKSLPPVQTRSIKEKEVTSRSS